MNPKLVEQLRTILRRYLPEDNYQVFIFGSRAGGEPSRWSDIDVGVLGREKLPGSLKIRIIEDLENSLIPFKIDLVDFMAVSDEFKSFALKEKIPL